ncbi:MAG: energy transducer TonB [Alphaproteobacteria bacterium]|nr:energy transducer TonB [Alphaproteobacteria bacterium]
MTLLLLAAAALAEDPTFDIPPELLWDGSPPIRVQGTDGGVATLTEAPYPPLPEEVDPERPPTCKATFELGIMRHVQLRAYCAQWIKETLEEWRFSGWTPAEGKATVEVDVTLRLERTGPDTWAWARVLNTIERSESGPVEPMVPQRPSANVGYERAQPRKTVAPDYPPEARAQGIEGSCVVRIFIDAKGVPSSVEVTQCPEALKEAARENAMQWRFYPAKYDGVPRTGDYIMRVNFKLN